MIGGIFYIFHRYGNLIAEKYGYSSCRLYTNVGGSGGLEGSNEDDPFRYNFLTWTDLKDAYYLMHLELAGILESGGKSWT